MKNENKKKLWTYVVSIVIALAVGGLSALINAGKMTNPELAQPPLSPPAWLFPIVWTILFTLMGISAARVYLSECKGKSDALFIYATQLVVNFLWTLLFFNLQLRLFAFFWLLGLLAVVGWMVSKMEPIDDTAAKLQIPYLVWLCFAAYLNFATWMLNRA